MKTIENLFFWTRNTKFANFQERLTTLDGNNIYQIFASFNEADMLSEVERTKNYGLKAIPRNSEGERETLLDDLEEDFVMLDNHKVVATWEFLVFFPQITEKPKYVVYEGSAKAFGKEEYRKAFERYKERLIHT